MPCHSCPIQCDVRGRYCRSNTDIVVCSEVHAALKLSWHQRTPQGPSEGVRRWWVSLLFVVGSRLLVCLDVMGQPRIWDCRWTDYERRRENSQARVVYRGHTVANQGEDKNNAVVRFYCRPKFRIHYRRELVGQERDWVRLTARRCLSMIPGAGSRLPSVWVRRVCSIEADASLMGQE